MNPFQRFALWNFATGILLMTTPATADDARVGVIVELHSVQVSSSVDTDVLLFEDRADLYGKIQIGSDTFPIPRIDGSDFPHWDSTNGIFTAELTGADTAAIPIIISIWDQDGAASGDDDNIDISPIPNHRNLELTFDPCRLRVNGDISSGTQGLIRVKGNSGGEAHEGTIQFKIRIDEKSTPLENDIAVLDFDVVQVIDFSEYLVAGKPAVVRARISNTTGAEVATSMRVEFQGPGGVRTTREAPLTLPAVEVQDHFLFVDDPFRPPVPRGADNALAVRALLDPTGEFHSEEADDCKRDNDRVVGLGPEQGIRWELVETASPRILWAKVGTLKDAGFFATDEQFDEIRLLGRDFIRGVYPLAELRDQSTLVPIMPPISAGVADVLVTLAGALGIPIDSLQPFAMVLELDALAALIDKDRIMGVLPSDGWLRTFAYDLWATKSGVTLGEYAPRAVMFLPRKDRIEFEPAGPSITLPGHELGHTYGLSVDPRLRTSIFCGIDDDLSRLACAADGGVDEYESDTPGLELGVPSSGFWVAQGGESPGVLPLLNTRQERPCLMGSNRQNAHLFWTVEASDEPPRGRWIDRADYEHLVKRLAIAGDPDVVYVSGVIDSGDRIALGPWYCLSGRTADRVAGASGFYEFRFHDDAGKVIQTVGLPMHWGARVNGVGLRATFFGQYLPLPTGTSRIDVCNRGVDRILASKSISPSAPQVTLHTPENHSVVSRDKPVLITWNGIDLDGDAIEYTVLIKEAGAGWIPLGHRLREGRLWVDLSPVSGKSCQLKVLGADGMNVGTSQVFELTLK